MQFNKKDNSFFKTAFFIAFPAILAIIYIRSQFIGQCSFEQSSDDSIFHIIFKENEQSSAKIFWQAPIVSILDP